MKQGFVYIMASATRTIYTVTRLVWFAEFERMDDAIAWEKALKGKTRAKKMALIEERNPRWNDLAWDWFRDASSS
jgi:putative endonuclease